MYNLGLAGNQTKAWKFGDPSVEILRLRNQSEAEIAALSCCLMSCEAFVKRSRVMRLLKRFSLRGSPFGVCHPF